MLRSPELKLTTFAFRLSRTLDGSDAVTVDPDYSAAYVVLHTDRPGLEGHGLTFTNGRGNDLVCAAIRVPGPRVKGRTLESIAADMAGFGTQSPATRNSAGSIQRKALFIWLLAR